MENSTTMWKLINLNTKDITHIRKDECLIGRCSKADILCLVKHVSRYHAKIIQKDGNIYLRDITTSNGTFLNNNKLEADTDKILKNGDIISLGTRTDYPSNFIEHVVKFEVQEDNNSINENEVRLNKVPIDETDKVPVVLNNNNFDIVSIHSSEDSEIMIVEEETTTTESNKSTESTNGSEIMIVEEETTTESNTSAESTNGSEINLNCDEVIDVPTPLNISLNNGNEVEFFKAPEPPKADTSSSKLFDESIIILSDDDDEEFSCSQLLKIEPKKEADLDDSLYPYGEIKNELMQMNQNEDEENIFNQVPFDLDDELSTTCDLLNCLESPNRSKKSSVDDEAPSTSSSTSSKSTDQKSEKLKSKYQTFNNHLLIKSSYSSPPLVEAHHIPKRKKGASPKTGSKRNHEEDTNSPEEPKKPKTRSKRSKSPVAPEPKRNKPEEPTNPKTRSKRSKNPVAPEPKKLTKEEKNQMVKEGLKKIAKPVVPPAEKVVTRRTSVGTAKVKVSESRGSFLCAPGPSLPPAVSRKDPRELPKIPKTSNSILPTPRPNFKLTVDIPDVFEMLVRWNVSWLNPSTTITPPVNLHAPVKMSTSFNSFNDYQNIISPLLILETWEFISQTFHKENLTTIKVIKLTHRFLGQNLYIDCKCYLEKNQRSDIIKSDDFALIEYLYTDSKTNKKILQMNFGLIQNVIWRKIDQNDRSCFDTSLVGLDNPHTKLSFTIMTKNVEGIYPMSKTFLVQPIANLKINFKMFKTLRSLEKSPICKMILKPALEDYTFPSFRNSLVCGNMLNPQQKHIVKEAACLCLGNTSGLYLVQGPPGTGKSRLIVNLLFQILLAERKKKSLVLLTAPSNNAVDNLVIKICEFRHILTDEQRKALRVVRMGPEASIGKAVVRSTLSYLTKKDMFKKTNHNVTVPMSTKERDEFMKKHYGHHYNYVYRITEAEIMNGCNVICTTLNSCLHNQIMEALNRKNDKFTCCIIDEATQCNELECLAPTQLGIDKFVLVGDPKQLPALVSNPQASQLGYSKSLFQRIIENFHTECPVRTLCLQYRMHEEICRFPNNKFYKGKLISQPSYQNKIKPNVKPYLVFSIKEVDEDSQSLYENKNEVTFVKELVRVLVATITSTCPITIGVLTPYSSQKKLITHALGEFKMPSHIQLNINTVDSFQGQEQDIVIISCVRHSTNNFLQSENRLNVALTRAKQALYVIGTYNLLKQNQLLYDLREDAKIRKLLVDFQGISTKLADYLHKYIFK